MIKPSKPESAHVIGIDLAWQSEKNPSAVAVGRLGENSIDILKVEAGIIGLENILALIDEVASKEGPIEGVAVDASLIINNKTGQRECERQISKTYGGRKAGCHASNLNLYPDPDSVKLAKALAQRGYCHLSSSRECEGEPPWMIEVYPHPALIEMFELPERLLYKKGRVDQKRAGQVNLAQLLRELSTSPKMKLNLNGSVHEFLDEQRILANKGSKLKDNEDALDAIVCAYIGALYSVQPDEKVFGDTDSGYIYVPQGRSVREKLPWLDKLVLFQSFLRK